MRGKKNDEKKIVGDKKKKKVVSRLFFKGRKTVFQRGPCMVNKSFLENIKRRGGGGVIEQGAFQVYQLFEDDGNIIATKSNFSQVMQGGKLC